LDSGEMKKGQHRMELGGSPSLDGVSFAEGFESVLSLWKHARGEANGCSWE